MTVNEKEESWLSVEAVKVSWSPQPVDASPNMMTATATQRDTPDSLGHNFSRGGDFCQNGLLPEFWQMSLLGLLPETHFHQRDHSQK